MNASSNRRRFMRHDDEILLRLRRLDAAEADAILANFPAWRLAYRLGDDLEYERERLGPAIGKLRGQLPEVAAYIGHLERRLDTLSRQLGTGSTASADCAALTRVNLSAQGLRCEHPGPFETDDAVEIGMALLPEYLRVATIGRVIRFEPASGDDPATVSINFDHILEHDQEALIRHVFRVHRELLTLRKAS